MCDLTSRSSDIYNTIGAICKEENNIIDGQYEIGLNDILFKESDVQ